MILSRLFKPKWQHPNPRVRKQAVDALNAADPILVQTSREDRDPNVRTAAVRRLADIAVLQQIAAWDTDPDVRDAASERFRTVMAGGVADGPPLSVRIAALEQIGRADLAQFLAAHGEEPELRSRAVARLEDDALLLERATVDPSVDVRLVSVERIHTPAVLERVVKSALNRDKRVWRRARERLEGIRAREAETALRARICDELEGLVDQRGLGQSVGRFQKLEREWQALRSEPDPHFRQRFEQARQTLAVRRKESGQRRTQKLACCKALEDLEARLAGEEELSDELAGLIEETLGKTCSQWEQAGSLDEAEERPIQERYTRLTHSVEEQQGRVQRNRERADALRALTKQAEQLRDRPEPIRDRDIQDLKKRWSARLRPESSTLTAQLQAAFDGRLDALQARQARQLEDRERALEEIQALLGDLEKSLADGALQQAISLHDRIRHRLRQAADLPRERTARLQGRLQAVATQLNKLRGWRNWGTQHARDALCAEVEDLVGPTEDPASRARQVREARVAWKRMDRAEGPAAETLWQRFDAACNRAYEPCQAYFDEQARGRKDNLERKRALCTRLTEFERATDWEQVDWRAADKQVRDAREQWRQIGPVDRADRKELERQYREVMQQLESHLEKERAADLRRRTALIGRVEALVQADDLRAAVDGAKRAQAEWRPTVQASRREEQELWRRFRAACDAIFERRSAERHAAEEERQANLAAKTALCEELESLAAPEGEAWSKGNTRLAEIQEEWARLGPIHKEAQHGIEKRFRAACELVQHRRDEQQQAGIREEKQSVRERAALAVRVEALLQGEQASSEAIEEARRAWAELATLKGSWERPLRGRFDRACQAALEGGEALAMIRQAAAVNGERKRELCLRMEILAGIDSPPEFAQARMEYQVTRLSGALGGDTSLQTGQDSAAEAWRVEREWYATGPAGDEDASLEARFQAALAAMST